MNLYQQIPPQPTRADLLRVCDMALALPAPKEGNFLDKVTSWFGADPVGVTNRLAEAVADVKALRGELAGSPGDLAGGAYTERLRRDCVIIEQEIMGMDVTSSKRIEDRAALLDDVTNPEAYLDTARNVSVGAVDPLGLRTDDNPGLFKKMFPNGLSLPSFEGAGNLLKIVAVVIGLIILLAIIGAIIARSR